MIRILLLTSNPEVEGRVSQLLATRLKGRYLLRTVEGVPQELPMVNEREADVVLGDLPDTVTETGRYLPEVLRAAGEIPFIALSLREHEEVELLAVQGGAQDCLLLPELTARALARAIRHGIERAGIERRLAREQEMLGSLLDQLPDRIYFKDRESRFLRVNRALAELFHARDPAAVVGRTDHDFFTIEHAQPALADEREVMRTGRPIINKMERETMPDGEVRWSLTSKLPLRDGSGAITGTFGISHDITQMKELEEAVDAERVRFKELSEDLHAKNLQMEQDLAMAKGIQEALLPGERVTFPAGAGAGDRRVVISSVYRPAAAVGGDFFTILPISEERVGVLICDIMGHGLRAALGTAILRGLIEQVKLTAARPEEFLTALNRGLRAILRNIDEPLLVTAFYLVADVVTGELEFATAGHPGPVLGNRTTGEVRELTLDRTARGPALALFDDAVYGVQRHELGWDGVLVLFTDGAIEMSNPRGGVLGLEHFVESAREHVQLEAGVLCENVLADIQQSAGGVDFDDDVCLLVLERRGLEQEGAEG